MSQSKAAGASDEEFQDALSHPVTEKSNEEIIEEITKKQGDLKLPDEDEDEEAEVLKDDEEAEVLEDDDDDEVAKSWEEPMSGPGDSDGEEALKEMEKELTPQEMKMRKAHAERLKLMGNEHFKNGKAKQAIRRYTTALQICPTTEHKDRAILFANRAAAKIKNEDKEAAIKDCTKAIKLWPEYVRAILRRAKLYHDADKLEEALTDYQLVYKLDPGNNEAREAMVRLPPQIEERNERMKAEMMDKLKDLGNMILKPFGLSTSNFQMQQDPGTGSYSINFNQNQKS